MDDDDTYTVPTPLWHAPHLDADGREIVALVSPELTDEMLAVMPLRELESFVFIRLSTDETYALAYAIAERLDCRFYYADAAQIEGTLDPLALRRAGLIAARLIASPGISPDMFRWIAEAIFDEAESDRPETFTQIFHRIGARLPM